MVKKLSDGSNPVAYVISKNQMHRPALTGEQKVKLYLGLRKAEEKEAEKRMLLGKKTLNPIGGRVGESSKLAASGAGISSGSAARIDYIEHHAPELLTSIESGDMTVNGAYNKAKDEREVQNFVPGSS